ncbi:uncharacterized protein CEXT_526301 [Caerostris extrusa]|uniref:Uncharacterized protein n=1 Tax=Caerostris extrusa TaxID=172846 RepID=A0AAV4SFU7_CAEEX|nr:uncharacterized protein CEXT_526301 [Caerostris extrusa]
MSILKISLFLAVMCSILYYKAEASTIAELLEDGVTTPSTVETTYDEFRFVALCSPGSERRNTCEKCTKVTKDPKTYKMCCENLHGVRNWCRIFLDYTLPPRVVGRF